MKNNQPIIYFLFFILVFVAALFIFYSSKISAATVNATIKISVCGNYIAEGGEQCDGSDLRGKSCTDLGFDSGIISCSASCTFNTNSCTTSAEASAEAQFTASAGGTYALSNGSDYVKVTLPPNFYTQDLQMQAFSYSNSFFSSSKPAPAGKNFIGKTYKIVFVNPDGEVVSTLSQAVTIVLTYTDSDVNGIDQSTLAPYRWGSSDSSWQLISGATVNTTNKTVTFSTASFGSFVLFGSQQQQQQNNNAGGGGGGGGYIASQAAVSFSGRAYPKSTVTILKDAQVAATTIVDANANFSVTVSGLSGGNYIFSVYSEDDKGSRSSLLTFPASVTSGVTTNIGSIFIAPTIAVDKSEVKKGENIAFLGQSAPQADITIAISSDGEFYGKTRADANGTYLYNFDTSQLDTGQHYAKSKAAKDGAISSFSKVLGFTVGTKTVLAKPTEILKGDLNGDGRVNLVDFSISSYWYKRANPPASVDLNDDGNVDLIDFSIMAFYWTG